MGGGIELTRTLNDLGLESEIPDFIARSESAKNDLFSKSRLLPLYAGSTFSDFGTESAFYDFGAKSVSASILLT